MRIKKMHGSLVILNATRASEHVMDAGLIGCCPQAVEHYEMAPHGAVKAWAEQLEMEVAIELWDETIEEEKGSRRETERVRARRSQPAGPTDKGTMMKKTTKAQAQIRQESKGLPL